MKVNSSLSLDLFIVKNETSGYAERKVGLCMSGAFNVYQISTAIQIVSTDLV